MTYPFRNRRATPIWQLSAAASLDPATTAWVNAVVTAGGTVSTTQKGFVDTLIKSLKSNGLFNGPILYAWLRASENTFQANIDIIGLKSSTVHGSPAFTASQGYTGDGSAAYIDTGVNASVQSINSAAIGTYIRSSITSVSVNAYSMGVSDGTNETQIIPLTTTNLIGWDINSAVLPAVSNSNTQGFWIASRTGPTTDVMYKNGSSFSAQSDSSGGLPSSSFNFFTLGLNASGTVFRPCSYQIAIDLIATGMTATQVSNASAAFNAYMTSLGTNVY